MRRLLLVAAMCGVASVARAADMPDMPFLRGGLTEGLSNTQVNWRGFYGGGQVSYSSVTSNIAPGINADLQGSFVPPPGVGYNWRPLPFADDKRTGFGGFFGYNTQWDDLVLGFEGNYIHDGLRSEASSRGLRYEADNITVQSATNSSAVVRLSDFGSARIRAGYVMGSFLPYAFAGTGIGSQTIDRVVSTVPDPIRGNTAASKTKLVYGYSVGAGVDVMLVAGLFMRAEYEYRRVTSDVDSTINSARLGLGYKF